MRPAQHASLLFALALCCACGPSQTRDTGLDGLRLDTADPGLIVPGSTLVLCGASFVDAYLGSTKVVFDGVVGTNPVQFQLPARFVSAARVEVPVDAAFIAAVGGRLQGQLEGTLAIEVRSSVDAQLHRSTELQVSVPLQDQATPSLARVGDGPTYVNQPIELEGTNFLLGGDEGTLAARLTGCFTPSEGGDCGPPVDVTLPAQPTSEFDRTRASIVYATSISGIGPGHFSGVITLVNQHKSGAQVASDTLPVAFDVRPPMISGASTTAASLGQYVVIDGGGFVGGADDESTVLHLVGGFVDRQGKQTPLDVVLVPEFLSGPQLRFVLDENDSLGTLIDLRKRPGTITGTIAVTVQKGEQTLSATPIPVKLEILPVKQVVFIEFQNSYLSSLHLFGLHAADAQIRARTIALSQRIYDSLNIEFRSEQPTDFALYSTVDIAGPDPNGLGYYGYDNTPGKDVGNLRLYDRIGGVNATTQADGYAGFGGVFVESFFSFSNHPNGLAEAATVEPMFDSIFDPFRPDAGGNELTATELAALDPPILTSGDGCPAAHDDRRMQVACAIWTLGNLIASTMVHEVGHSLGLSDPYGPSMSYHNIGDLPDRLMEVGEARPFTERALLGDGPAQFCDTEYDYLRTVLPSDSPPTTVMRQPCD
jgi:hypothetical protein